VENGGCEGLNNGIIGISRAEDRGKGGLKYISSRAKNPRRGENHVGEGHRELVYYVGRTTQQRRVAGGEKTRGSCAKVFKKGNKS